MAAEEIEDRDLGTQNGFAEENAEEAVAYGNGQGGWRPEVLSGRRDVSDNEAGEDDESLASVLDTPALPLMLDVPMEVTVEIDRVQLSLAEVLALQPGSVVQLSRVPGEPLDLLVNGRPVARGEIVVVNDVFAFRVVEIISRGSVAQKAA